MSLAAIDKAKRCPWGCNAGVWLWDKGVPGKFAVACSSPTCAATGPVRDTKGEAVTAWNSIRRDARGLASLIEDEMHGDARRDLEPGRGKRR